MPMSESKITSAPSGIVTVARVAGKAGLSTGSLSLSSFDPLSVSLSLSSFDSLSVPLSLSSFEPLSVPLSLSVSDPLSVSLS